MKSRLAGSTTTSGSWKSAPESTPSQILRSSNMRASVSFATQPQVFEITKNLSPVKLDGPARSLAAVRAKKPLIDVCDALHVAVSSSQDVKGRAEDRKRLEETLAKAKIEADEMQKQGTAHIPATSEAVRRSAGRMCATPAGRCWADAHVVRRG